MLAETKESQGSIPYLDKASGNVCWEGRIFQFTTFYFINETTTLLLNILDRDPLKVPVPRETVSSLILGQSEFLGQSLSATSVDVLRHWVHASISIKEYVLSQAKKERFNARDRLLKIREILHLDDLFGKRETLNAPDENQ